MKEYTVKVDDQGNRFWRLNGLLHREDGPAIESSATKSWWLNGLLHREDGPAIELDDGTKYWRLNGIAYSEEDYWNQIKPAKELTVAEIEALLGHRIKVVGNA